MKEQILQISENVFNRLGIKSVSMDEIASELGSSKKTLYAHYQNKEELVQEVMYKKLNELNGMIQEVETKSENAILELVHIFSKVSDHMASNNPVLIFDLKKYYPHLFKKFREYRDDYIKSHFVRNMERGKEQGYFWKDLNPRIISDMYFNMIEFITGSEFEEKTLLFPERYRHAFMYHLRSVCNPKGLEELEKYLHLIEKKQI